MNTVTIEKSFCTTREAATLLGVSVGTVQLWVESGLLQAWKTTGGHRRVIRESVERLLRKAPAAASAASSAVPPPSVPAQLRVMVVEDETDLLRLYQTRIGQWPMRPSLTCVDNAVSALMMLGRGGGPDLLVTDLHMPGMDGFAMLRVLSQAPEVQYTRMLLVTGLDAAAIAAQGGIAPGIEVLSNPIPFDRLLAIAQEMVSQRGYPLP